MAVEPQQPPNGPDFKEDKDGTLVTDVSAADDSAQYGDVRPTAPNSLFIPLGKLGHLSWQSESGVSVLALLIFVVTAVLMLLGVIVMWLSNAQTWTGEFVHIIGQVMLTVVGAVLGASATKK